MHDVKLRAGSSHAEEPRAPWTCRLPIGEVELALLSVPIEPACWPDGLTESEKAVARRLIRGRSYRDIARERGVSEETVSAQVTSMMRKLHVDSAHRLVARLAARQSGLES